MADPTTNTPGGTAQAAAPVGKTPSMQPIVGTGEDEGFALDMPLDGTAPGMGTPAGAVGSVEIGSDGKALDGEVIPPGDGAIPATETTPATEEPPAEGDTDTTPPPQGAVDTPLEAWDPTKPEVVTAYEKRYFDEAGKLNLLAVTKEFWSNAKDGKNGTLREDTYKYLEETLGVTKDAAKAIEKGLVADQAQENSRFWQRVGGKQRYAAALEWGKATYSPADKARFNAAINGLDVGARDDVIDALLSRYERANPGARQQQLRRGPPRRQAAPARSVTAQAEGVATAPASQVPYANSEAYTKAWQAAIATENAARTPAEKRAAASAREKVRQDGRASMKTWK